MKRNIVSINYWYSTNRQKTQLKISDVRVMRGPECGTDHFLVVAKSSFLYKQKMQSNGLPEKNGTPLSNVKYNIESLRNDSTKFLYEMRLATKLNRIGQGSPNDMYESLKTCIHEATNEALGEKIVSTRYRKDTPWWSEELGKIVDEKKAAYGKWLSTQSTQDRLIYNDKKRSVQKEIIKAKNEYWEERCQEVNVEAGNTKANKAWKIINGMRRQHKDTAGMNIIPIEDWKTYYQNLLTENRTEFIQDHESHPVNPTESEHPTRISSTDINKALQQMKNGKAPGLGNVSVELLKAAPSEVLEILADIFSRCLNGEDPPKEWKKAIITSIFIRKGADATVKTIEELVAFVLLLDSMAKY